MDIVILNKMGIWDKITGKEEKPQVKTPEKHRVDISNIEGTSFNGETKEHVLITDPISYKPTYNFPDYFHAYETLFYIPPKIANLKLHEFLIKDPEKYPFDMTHPLALGNKVKPISFSIDLMNLFKRKENLPETEKGRIYFGKVPNFKDDLNEKKINDIVLSEVIEQYREVFKSRFNIDPIEVNGTNAFHYQDPRGTIDPKTNKPKIRGINDVSRGQFTLYATGNSISIADGRTVKNNKGMEIMTINKPSTNGTILYNAKGYLIKDLSLESGLEVIASAPISEFHKPTNYCYAAFGHELVNIGEKFSPIKGYNFIMLLTPTPLVTPETLKQEFAFKYIH